MNGDRYFLDTNLFVYRFDASAPHKAERARELIAEALTSGRGVVSYQVTQEFCNVVLRRVAAPLSAAGVQKYVREIMARLPAVQSSLELLEEGLRIYQRYRLSWYDALIVAAAQEAGCAILYSEGFQHGSQFEGVRVVDPFR